METITLRLFTIGAKLHIWKICNDRGHGGAGRPVDVRLARTGAERRRNPHQGCRVSKIPKVGFELLRRNLPFMSELK